MAEFQLTRKADRDLIDIYLYTLETFGARQAEDYRTGITRCLHLLAANPRIGRLAAGLPHGVRRHEHGRHVIFYREDTRGVLILTILHRSMCPDLSL